MKQHKPEVVIEALLHDLNLIDEMIADLETQAKPLPECQRFDIKRHKKYQKSFLKVLAYYGWKP